MIDIGPNLCALIRDVGGVALVVILILGIYWIFSRD